MPLDRRLRELLKKRRARLPSHRSIVYHRVSSAKHQRYVKKMKGKSEKGSTNPGTLDEKVKVLLKLRGYRKKEEEEGEDIRDITVQQQGTDRRLLIRIVASSRLMSGNIGINRVKEMERDLKQRDIEGGILIGKGFTYAARTRAGQNRIELLSGISLPPFVILDHELVPKHEILSREETEKLLKKYHVKPWQLPMIKALDPAASMIGAKPGDILKITRKSPTAGMTIAYRYVVI